jgi:hypothetical protein
MAKFIEGLTFISRAKWKKTAQDIRNPKRSSMNKSKKRNFKKYKGQGKI